LRLVRFSGTTALFGPACAECATERDFSKALKISSAEAKQAMAAMQLQGYAKPIARTQKWRMTEHGLTVSGAKTARFTR
jgi:hypothetical protein